MFVCTRYIDREYKIHILLIMIDSREKSNILWDIWLLISTPTWQVNMFSDRFDHKSMKIDINPQRYDIIWIETKYMAPEWEQKHIHTLQYTVLQTGSHIRSILPTVLNSANSDPMIGRHSARGGGGGLQLFLMQWPCKRCDARTHTRPWGPSLVAQWHSHYWNNSQSLLT